MFLPHFPYLYDIEYEQKGYYIKFTVNKSGNDTDI